MDTRSILGTRHREHGLHTAGEIPANPPAAEVDLVRRLLAKQKIVGSIPISRSKRTRVAGAAVRLQPGLGEFDSRRVLHYGPLA